jgi:hypothetical protein
MPDNPETLRVGDAAPQFALHPANREGVFRSADLLARGPLILEFLRGTW